MADLSSRAARLLEALGRHGFLVPEQAARATGLGPATLRRAWAELGGRGWLGALPLVAGAGPRCAWQLTPDGRRALAGRRRDPQRVPRAQVVDQLLAGAELALQTPGWCTWPEARRAQAELGVPRGGLPPAGLKPDGRGGHGPVWVLPWPVAPGALRRSLLALARTAPGPAWAFVAPSWAERLRRAGLPVEVVPWDPPLLRVRAPLLPGWQSGAGRLTRRRLEVLGLLARFGHATSTQLAARLGAAAHRVLGELEAGGLVSGRRPWPGPAVWRATAAGLRAVGVPGRPAPDASASLRHTLALVDLAGILERQTGGLWWTERELRVRHMADLGPGALPAPDGALDLPAGRILVQLERSRARADHLLAFASRHCSAGTAVGVWYFCRPALAPWYTRLLAHDPRCVVWVWDGPGSRPRPIPPTNDRW